jgi:hypothetical protein
LGGDIFPVGGISGDLLNNNPQKQEKPSFKFIKQDVRTTGTNIDNSQNKSPINNTVTKPNLLEVFGNMNINNNTQQVEKNEAKAATGFSFIKKGTNPPKTDLESIFNENKTGGVDIFNLGGSSKPTANIPETIDLTKSIFNIILDYSVGIDDVFSHNKQSNVNIDQITSIYQQSFNQPEEKKSGYNATNLENILQNNFNYDQVYNTIDANKGIKKDPFCFVDDMLKKK